MIGQRFNHTNCLAASKRAWLIGCARRCALVGSILLGPIIADRCILGSEPLSAFSPSATEQGVPASRFSNRQEANSLRQVRSASSPSPNIDLNSRASEFGQQMRERFFRVHSSITPGTTNVRETTRFTAGNNTRALNKNASMTGAKQEVVATVPSSFASEQTGTGQSQYSPLRKSSYHAKAKPLARIVADTTSMSSDLEERQAEFRQLSSHQQPPLAAKANSSVDSSNPDPRETARVSGSADGINSTNKSLTQFQVELMQKFPGRNIKLQWSRESLVVTGTVADPQQAIQIVAFVRDQYLVPVIDRLEVPRVKPNGNR